MIDKKSLEKRIGFTLPEDLFANVPFEAGFFSKQKELYEKNKFFVEWGRSIILAAYAYYLYQNEQELTVDVLKKNINNSYQYLENEIYTTYKLKEFIIKGTSIPKNAYPEISSKLIVLIYKQHGFGAIIRFLFPFFKKHQNSKSLINKVIIQQFAKQTNQTLAYETVYISGDGKHKLYRCRIHIGNQYVEAKAVGIDKAQSAAELLFLQKYNDKIQPTNGKNQKIKKNTKLSEERKQHLNDAINLLKLNNKFLSIEQLDEVLTHPSFRSIHPNQKPYNNAMLAYLGFLLFDMFTYEYCCQRSVTFSDKRRDLIQKNSISDCLADEYLKYLLKSPNATSHISNDMKTDIFQGISASYWINYLNTKDEIISNCAKSFILTRIELSELINCSENLSFVENISAISGWNVKKSSKYFRQSHNKRVMFTATVTISGDNWEQSGIGTDYKESTALDLAAKNVLEKIVRYCDNPDFAAAIQNKITKVGAITGTDGTGSKTTTGTGGQKPDIDPPEEVSFDTSENTLYIFKGTISCRNKGHKITQATGLLVKLDGTAAKINVNYCATCKQYFIGLSEYEHYREIYGALLGNFSFRNFNFATGKGYKNLADESPLHLCGYTVRKDANLSVQKRRLILENIMDHHILDKDQIMNYLRFFISNSSSKKNFQAAVQKWTEDLDWVRNYRINKQRHFLITTIKRAK